MKSNKTNRFESNPDEKVFHDKFKERYENNTTTLSGIIFGWTNDYQDNPKRYLTEEEEDICLNLIQWLGSPVGNRFLQECKLTCEENEKQSRKKENSK
jgi:hypothetical protein